MVFLKRYNTDSSYQLELEVGEYPYNPAPLAIVCGAADGSIGDFSLVLLKRTMVDRRR